jgi:hypothetical protein
LLGDSSPEMDAVGRGEGDGDAGRGSEREGRGGSEAEWRLASQFGPRIDGRLGDMCLEFDWLVGFANGTRRGRRVCHA